MPAQEVLQRILQTLGLERTPFAELADPAEETRLRFEQSLSELVGRSLQLEQFDQETVTVARDSVEALFHPEKTHEQAYDAFCTVLVFYNVALPTREFFAHYLGVDAFSTLARFEARVEQFQRDAIRLYATFADAYLRLAVEGELEGKLLSFRQRSSEEYRRRTSWNVIENIPANRLSDLGYISAARVQQEQEDRQALVTFLLDLATKREQGVASTIETFSERKRRKMSSLLRKFGSSLRHDFMSPLFQPDPDELRRDAAKIAPKEKGELARIAETQRMGQRNLSRYLAADHLDVYIATSMRSDADFVSVNAFVQTLFAHQDVKPLRLRFFNPTQSWIEDRVAKGLVEALMLRRSAFAIYMAQKEDTFGKDSEASVALGQGKPVIVYVPRLFVPALNLDSSAVGSMSRDELKEAVVRQVGPSELDDTDDEQALIGQLIASVLGQASADVIAIATFEHWADFDLVGEARRIENEALRKDYRAWLDEVIQGQGASPVPKHLHEVVVRILTSLATNFERRAYVFREVHPLALQVIVQTGVPNGILVARSVDTCASLLVALIVNALDFDLESDENNYRLVERSTKSTVRVVSRNQLVTNAFLAFYKSSGADVLS